MFLFGQCAAVTWCALVSTIILVSTSVLRTTSACMGPSATAVTSTSPERWSLPWGGRITHTVLSAVSAGRTKLLFYKADKQEPGKT